MKISFSNRSYRIDLFDLSRWFDVAKKNNSKECIVSHYWISDHGFKFQIPVCNTSHNLMMLSLNISDIVIITVKGVVYCCIIHGIVNLKQFIC